ncbi:unnamed protein product [Calypogeia fissa]
MAGRGVYVLMAMLVTVSALLHSAAAVEFVVSAPGSNAYWTFLNDTTTSYDDEFKTQNLTSGDSLIFQFDSKHDLMEVHPQDIATCNSSNPIQTYTQSVTVTLHNIGQHGFLCSKPSHCSSYGMHLVVTVVAPNADNAPPHGGASSLLSGLPVVLAALVAVCAVLAL